MFCSLQEFSSRLTFFSFACDVLFLLLTLFTVCYAICDCLSSEFLVLLILTLNVIFLYYLDFFLTTADSHGILHSAVGLVGMHSRAVTTFSYLSIRVCVSDIF